MAWRTQIDRDLYKDNSGDATNAFITTTTDGVTSIRWHSTPGGILYDMTLDDTGVVVTTAFSTGGGSSGMAMGLLLTLTYP